MPPIELRILRDYESARRSMLDGDVCLHRGTAWYAPFLRAAGRSEYVHASMIAWWHGRVHLLQSVEWKDRKPLLSEVLRRAPGSIDVYQCRSLSGITRECIVADMIAAVGRGYGWGCLAQVSLSHLPIVRLFTEADFDDEEAGTRRPFCSQAIAESYAMNYMDLVPNLADRATEPGDLARSALLRYQFTID